MAREATQDERRAARARLALRAERAFGLESVRAIRIHDAPAEDLRGDDPPIDDPPREPGAQNEPDAARSSAQITAQITGRAGGASDLFARQEIPEPATAKPASSRPSGLHLPLATGSITTPLLSTDEKRQRLRELDENEVRGCTRCRLCEQRTTTVFGEGDPDAKIFFIGEGPGENEDRTGRPFVGRAGDLLNKQIAAMGLKREEVFIANVVKCRPPGNREPAPDEVATCTPYLERQLEIVRPRVIITLGRPAAHHMLGIKSSMSSMRGQWHQWRGIKLMPTFHPAYLLRAYTHANRAMVWDDLKEVMRELGMPIPNRGGA